jgi:tRNA pseudouridine55 synthase
MDGVLLVDKPAGLSSHDVVAAVRRALGRGCDGARPRVGHAGTLDPFATGLLLVLVGRATRVQRLLMALPKRYEAVAQLGALSSTGDPEGEIVATGRLPGDPPVLATGTLRQRPPAYSAVKLGGERAYRRARRGETFELAEREVTVHRFEQLWRRGDRAAFEIECSSGTYVRALIADLGDAYCLALRRTAIGSFSVSDAEPAPSGPGAKVGPPLDLERALSFLPRLHLEGEAARVAAHGVAVAGERGRWERSPAGAAEPVLILDSAGAVAVGETRTGPAGVEVKPVIGFRG